MTKLLAIAFLLFSPLCLAASAALGGYNFNASATGYMQQASTEEAKILVCWAKPDDLSAGRLIFCVTQSTSDTDHVIMYYDPGTPALVALSDAAGPATSTSAAATVVVDTWNHNGAYFNNSGSVYLNGVETTGDTDDGVNVVDFWLLGQRLHTTTTRDSLFDGEISECMQYLGPIGNDMDQVMKDLAGVNVFGAGGGGAEATVTGGMMVEFVGGRASCSNAGRGSGTPFTGGCIAGGVTNEYIIENGSSVWPLNGYHAEDANDGRANDWTTIAAGVTASTVGSAPVYNRFGSR